MKIRFPCALPHERETIVDRVTRLRAWQKSFIQRVIITVPNQPHQGAYSSLGSTMPEGKQRILRSLVRTMHHLARTTLPAGHLERIEYQLGRQAVRHRPAHHLAADAIKGSASKETLPCWGHRCISATHSRLGARALKSRFTRSGAGRASGRRTVMRDPL